MYIIKTTLDEAVQELNFISNWINTICREILNKEVENEKVSVFYNYGYFVPKGSGFNINQLDMMYPERLKHELSKVRVNVTIKIDNFIMSNRIENGFVPSSIELIVEEITKLKMRAEFEILGNRQIFDSVPDIDQSIVTIQKDSFLGEQPDEDFLDIDGILDKIQLCGLSSLTEKEKDFLDKKSKEM